MRSCLDLALIPCYFGWRKMAPRTLLGQQTTSISSGSILIHSVGVILRRQRSGRRLHVFWHGSTEALPSNSHLWLRYNIRICAGHDIVLAGDIVSSNSFRPSFYCSQAISCWRGRQKTCCSTPTCMHPDFTSSASVSKLLVSSASFDMVSIGSSIQCMRLAHRKWSADHGWKSTLGHTIIHSHPNMWTGGQVNVNVNKTASSIETW